MEGEIILVFIIFGLIGVPLFLYVFMSGKKEEDEEAPAPSDNSNPKTGQDIA